MIAKVSASCKVTKIAIAYHDTLAKSQLSKAFFHRERQLLFAL